MHEALAIQVLQGVTAAMDAAEAELALEPIVGDCEGLGKLCCMLENRDSAAGRLARSNPGFCWPE